MTAKLLDPHNLPTGQKIKRMQGYKLMWQLIGFHEYPDNVPCIKQFEETVLMIGSGKMALQRSAHKIKWQKTAHGNDPYNKQILILSKKISCIHHYRIYLRKESMSKRQLKINQHIAKTTSRTQLSFSNQTIGEF